MTIKKPFLFCLLLASTSISSVYAQTIFEVPQNVELSSKDDYAKYEPAIIDAAKWLEATDLDKEADKRKEVNSFVLRWVSGSPTISIDITEKLAKLYGKNAQLLGIYLASYARNFLENKNTVLKREQILTAIWGQDDYFFGRSLDVFVSRLRKIFAADQSIKIETLHGIGFKLVVA